MKTALKYGLAGGLIMVLISQLFYLVGDVEKNYSLAEILGYVSILVGLSVSIALTHRVIRNRSEDGSLSFGKAFVNGLTLSAVSGAIFGIFVILLYTVISPGFHEKLSQGYLNQMKESGASPEEIAAAVEQMQSMPEWASGALFQGFIMFMTVFMIGIFLSLIISAIMMKKPRSQAIGQA